MKKTLIALLALAGMASGATLMPLTENTWTHESLRSRATWTQDTAAGTLTLDNSNWGQAVSTYTLDQATALDSFTVDITRGNVSAGLFFTLIGESNTISIGTQSYGSGELFYGISTNTNANSYSLNTDAWDGGITVAATSLLADALNYGATASISGTFSVNDAGNTILTLSASSTATANTGTATIDLGKDFEVKSIKIGGDGANNATGIWTVSNVSLTPTALVPEPATASLSLLGLAALMIRRRRA